METKALIMNEYLQILIFGIATLTVAIISYFILIWFKSRIVNKTKDKTILIELLNIALKRLQNIVIFVLILFLSAKIFFQNYTIGNTINIFISLILFIQIAYVLDGIISYLISNNSKFEANKRSQVKNAVSLIKFISRSIIWSIAVLLCIENIGIDITALVAGLGIGGIAIALAAQNILGDLFASLAIVLDRPFEIDDYIVVGDISGTVEHIGIKTTRIRALSGEELICSNADLLGSRVRNYKRMIERRALCNLGIVYQIDHKLLVKVPKILEKIIDDIEFARFDRATFKSFGDSSLIFELVYYVQVPDNDYNEFMNIQQKINFEIFKKFEQQQIEFAYPTQTLHISKD